MYNIGRRIIVFEKPFGGFFVLPFTPLVKPFIELALERGEFAQKFHKILMQTNPILEFVCVYIEIVETSSL